jgi:hypothetical protein
VTMPLAHIGGLPIEETLPAIAPVACVFAAFVGTMLGGLGEWLRRR